jgi:hypothetical protein
LFLSFFLTKASLDGILPNKLELFIFANTNTIERKKNLS